MNTEVKAGIIMITSPILIVSISMCVKDLYMMIKNLRNGDEDWKDYFAYVLVWLFAIMFGVGIGLIVHGTK